MEELASVLKLETRVTIYNQINAGTFPIRTYKDGRGRFADYQDVAEYLEKCRERANSSARAPVLAGYTARGSASLYDQ